ncbi:ScbR family autoregulator-binding transcription factor [Actinokineospora sp.]|uniref:ScbR family autoregulator-binding transcription factor n=1 Tax=Actinokineospora sp. TaxID=1872133 RepID=UPI00403771DD
MTKQARSEQSRTLLLRAAAELLSRDGYERAGMVAIAEAAGMTKGGLYFHFQSKDDVCDAVQEIAVARLTSFTERLREQQPSAARRLIDLTHALARWIGDEPEIGASVRMAREVGSQGVRFSRFVQSWVDAVRAEADAVARAGELTLGATPDVAALLASALCLGLDVLTSLDTADSGIDMAKNLADLWALILPQMVGEAGALLLDLLGSTGGE